jgi:hypothetical protein
VSDRQTISGMRSRIVQLHQIADMAHNQEISELLRKVAAEIQAELKRLEREPE